MTNNRRRMNYAEYRRDGLPLTSSLIESLIKEFSLREKRTEKFWDRGRPESDEPSKSESIWQVQAALLSDDDRLSRHIRNRPGSPLQGMPLTQLWCDVRLYHPADETLPKSRPLKTLRGAPVAEFWKQLAARRQAAEEFVESVAKLPAEKQVKVVRARLTELSWKLDPNSIATLGAKLAGLAVTEATLILSNYHPHDLTPLTALGGLKKLTITGGVDWLDLSPVNALPLEELTSREAMAKKNAPVLAEIETLKRINGRPAA